MVLRSILIFLWRLFVAFLILGVILGFAAFFVIRNIDPNIFRAEFERYLTDQMGFRAELGTVNLRWGLQPQLRVLGLKLYHPQSLQKILQSYEVQMNADWIAVLHGDFKLSQIVIRDPEIFLVRDRRGVGNWQIDPAKPSSASHTSMLSQAILVPIAYAAEMEGRFAGEESRRPAEGWGLGARKILVHDATVHFLDESVEPAFKLDVEHIELEGREKRFATECHFTASGSVFHATRKNLELTGDFYFQTKLLDFELRYDSGKAVLRGKLKGVDTWPHFDGTLEASDLDMESLTPEAFKKGDYVTGRLSVKTSLAFDGANPGAIERSLGGRGTLDIREGAVKNRNLVKEVFERLSPVFAVAGALGGELPPEVDEMMKGQETPFQSVHVVYGVQDGNFNINEFQLIHSNYQLSGQGSYGIQDRRVEGSVQLALSPAISVFLMGKIHEMALLADADGQMMIPFRLNGVFPNVTAQPDLSSIGSILLQGGTNQLISRGVERLSKALGVEKVATVGDSGASSASAEDAWVQQGLELFSKLRRSKKK